jgi:hypothetical protein
MAAMIIDRREIQFEAEALLVVIAGSPRAAASLGLPPGLPQAVVFDPGAEAVRLVWSQGKQKQAEVLDAVRLGALLVGFCLRMRVPLPRRATKSIRVESGLVALEFVTRIKPDVLSLLPEGRPVDGGPAHSERKWGVA